MSSSQGGNSTSIIPGYTYYLESIQDASEWTRQLKECRAYVSYSTQTTGNKNTGSDPWLKYGNQFRYTYLFGKFKYGPCEGAAFNSGVVGGN